MIYDNELVPSQVSDEERWICTHKVDQLRVEYRQTGDDTAETLVHLTATNGEKVVWLDRTFAKVAETCIDTATCVKPRYGVRERVKARLKWERDNERDLAEYNRLKAKFGATNE